MKKLNWKAPAVYTTIGAIVGSTLMSSPAAMAEQSFKSYWAKFAQNGQQSGSAAAILYGGTNYFGIYYLQQLLKQDGISVSWDGKELQLSGVPVQQTTTLSVSGSTPSSSTSSPLLTDSIQVNGVTYVPLSTVQAMLSSSGVHLREGDQTDGSGGSTTANSSISAGSVQRVAEHLKEAVSSLSAYSQAMAKIQQQTSLLQGLFAPREGGDTKEALQHLASAMQKMQSAYTDLTALASAASSAAASGTGTAGTGTSGSGTTGSTTSTSTTTTSGTTGTSGTGTTTGSGSTTGSTSGSGTTTGSTDTTGTTGTSGSGTGSSSGTTTTTTPTLSNADLATQLQTIAAAIQQDITNLNALAMASLGTSNSGTSGGSGSATGSSTGTSTTTGSTSGTTTTPTSPTTTSPADVSGVVSDLNQQIQSLQALQAQLGSGDSSGSSSHDN